MDGTLLDEYSQPFSLRRDGPIAFLDICNKGSSVNVINSRAVDQIIYFFDNLPRDKSIKLIVLQSKMPYSFFKWGRITSN